MTPSVLWYPGIVVANAVLGVLLVVGVFHLMERQVGLGAVGGTIIGAGVIYVEATLGEQLLTVSVGEMKMLVLAASFGAVLGVIVTVLTIEPEL